MRRFEELNPWTVLLWFIAAVVPIMFIKNPVLILLSLLSVMLLRNRMIGKKITADAAFSVTMIMAVSVINLLFSHNGATVLLVVNNNRITLEALLYGMASGGMLAGIFLWFGLINALSSTDRILYLFGGLSSKLALTVSMTMRFVALIKKQASGVRMALKASGEYGDGNGFDAIKVNLKVFSCMTTWLLENGIISADSMAARGFMTGRRTGFSIYRFTGKDAAYSVAVCTAGLVFTALYKILNLDYIYYPELSPADLMVRAVPIYLIYIFVCLIPLYSRSKHIGGISGKEGEANAFID